MRAIPLIPTLFVALAVAAMIALGVWQLERREEKRAALARYSANLAKPMIAFAGETADGALRFRRARARCEAVIGWEREGGRSADAAQGWRQIALCRTPAPALLRIEMGVARAPGLRPHWAGGDVTGILTQAPDHRPLIATLIDPVPRPLMLVAERPAPGLMASARPALSSVPNNHLAYAVQWFLFAAVAVVIYALALRRRYSGATSGAG